jgi:hypothetical protein
MIIQKLLPGVLKEILTHVPTILFKVVKWDELVSEIPLISKRILNKQGAEDLRRSLEILLPKNIKFNPQNEQKNHQQFGKESGNLLLKLYFTQIFSKHGLFLDLRSQNFNYENDHLNWCPTGLWVQLTESFRLGLIDVYKGFYFQDDQLYKQGLKNIGMLNETWGDEDKDHLAKLFKSHFGSALDEEMTFDLDHFKDSILKVCHFMLDKEIHISKDFLYLGIYLVTLYDHLQLTGSSHPVKEIFFEVVKNQT